MHKKISIMLFAVIFVILSLYFLYDNQFKLVEIRVPDNEFFPQIVSVKLRNIKITRDPQINELELIFNKGLEDVKGYIVAFPGLEQTENACTINDKIVLISGNFSQGITLLLVKAGLRSVNGEKLKSDIPIFLNGTPFSLPDTALEETFIPIAEKRDDLRDIGFVCDINTIPAGSMEEKDLFVNGKPVPLFDEANGSVIENLRNGTSVEVLLKSDEFVKVKLHRNNGQVLTGFVERQFFFDIPEPLGKDTYYIVYPQQFLCVIAKKFTDNIPRILPYFPYIESVSPYGSYGVMIIERKTLPLDSVKMSILELNALFETMRNSFKAYPVEEAKFEELNKEVSDLYFDSMVEVLEEIGLDNADFIYYKNLIIQYTESLKSSISNYVNISLQNVISLNINKLFEKYYFPEGNWVKKAFMQ